MVKLFLLTLEVQYAPSCPVTPVINARFIFMFLGVGLWLLVYLRVNIFIQMNLDGHYFLQRLNVSLQHPVIALQNAVIALQHAVIAL